MAGLGGLGAVYGGMQQAESADEDLTAKRLQNQQTQQDMLGQQLLGRGLQGYYSDLTQDQRGPPPGQAPGGQGAPQQQAAPVAAPPGLAGMQAPSGQSQGSILPGGAQILGPGFSGGGPQAPPAGAPPPSGSQSAAGGAGPAPAAAPKKPPGQQNGQKQQQPQPGQPGWQPDPNKPLGPDNPPDFKTLVSHIVRDNPGASPGAIAAAFQAAARMPYWNQQERMQLQAMNLQLRDQALTDRENKVRQDEQLSRERLNETVEQHHIANARNAALLFETQRRNSMAWQRNERDEREALEKRDYRKLQQINQNYRSLLSGLALKAQNEGADKSEIDALVAGLTKQLNDSTDEYAHLKQGQAPPSNKPSAAQPGAKSILRRDNYDPATGFSPAGP